jgi:S-adenosylmethionine:tRNA ribosyltransferase-isomerase
MRLKLFEYMLPQSLIAQHPIENREESRMLVLERKSGRLADDFFFNLPLYLDRGDVLVINESKVNKCRLFGKKEKTGANIECFVLEKISGNKYLVLIRPSRRLKAGNRVLLGENGFRVISMHSYGRAVVEFDLPIKRIYEKYGTVPLPPYIKNRDVDAQRYQTVFAKKAGSTAAPTAGLHFTEKLMDRLKKCGVIIARVSLHIGLDTFRPISSENIEDHRIHSERYMVRKEEASKIQNARENGRKIIAVGTTTVRVLETLAEKYGKIKQDRGVTDIYIYPGFRFRAVDWMITNFHLPRSTLLVMVCAFAGRDKIFKAYDHAIANNYRFYSFGDCMLIR